MPRLDEKPDTAGTNSKKKKRKIKFKKSPINPNTQDMDEIMKEGKNKRNKSSSSNRKT